MSEKLLKISQVSKLLNVSIKVLRQWDDRKKFCAIRTPGNQRMYRESDIYEFMGRQKPVEIKRDSTCLYSRVSSNEQKTKGDLDRQSNRLVEYSVRNSYNITYILQGVGSGMSDARPKLLQAMKLAMNGLITRIVIEHRDRLTRFNFNLIKVYFESHNVEVVYISESSLPKTYSAESSLPKTYSAELVEDMLSLMSSFSAKIYGKRSGERRKRTGAEGRRSK